MSILIIGANGQVGRHCVQQAKQRQLPYYSCTRNSLDLSDSKAISLYIEQLKPSAVVNCAAYTAVDKAEVEVELATAINYLAPEAMAISCQRLGIPLIHLSTDYVFSGDKIGSYSEEDTTSPINHYGKTKLQGEQAVLNNCNKAFVLRTSWVFSEYGNNFVKTMLKVSKTHDNLNIISDQWGCPTYAGTIAEVIFDLINKTQKQEIEQYGVYHLCNSGRTNWYQFAEAIFTQAQAAGKIPKRPTLAPIPSSDYPTPAKRPKNSELCCLKLEQFINMKLPHWKLSLPKI